MLTNKISEEQTIEFFSQELGAILRNISQLECTNKQKTADKLPKPISHITKGVNNDKPN